MTASFCDPTHYENLYSQQMVELRNNKNNNNLKKLHEKSTSDNSNLYTTPSRTV